MNNLTGGGFRKARAAASTPRIPRVARAPALGIHHLPFANDHPVAAAC
jgi:hypothetical protein